jgi:hypothetical protein
MLFSATNAHHTGAGRKKIKTCFEERKIFCLSARINILSDMRDDASSISAFD